jgi:hypothetical protein
LDAIKILVNISIQETVFNWYCPLL